MKRIILTSLILLTGAGITSPAFGNKVIIPDVARSVSSDSDKRTSPGIVTPSANLKATMATAPSGKNLAPIRVRPTDTGWVKRDLNGLHPRQLGLHAYEQESNHTLGTTHFGFSYSMIAIRALGYRMSVELLANTEDGWFSHDDQD